MLPISILIPARQCAGLVPGHLESLRSWLDLAEEVVVVDSDSRDATVELLRAGLAHPRVKFLNHPPGLFESWNHGVRNVSGKYVYIATVGDGITRKGIEHLLELAEKYQSDVVISNPDFISADGAALPNQRWPIDVILRGLKIEHPRLLTTTEQFVYAMTNLWGAILGNSASNLYRTECLKERPFPTDFGRAGDLGWSVNNIFDVKIAITPERFSTFRFHEKPYASKEEYVESLCLKALRLAQGVIRQQRARDANVDRILEEARWIELEALLEEALLRQVNLEEYRRQKIPWYFKPAAWRMRVARNHAERRIREITKEVVAKSLGAGE